MAKTIVGLFENKVEAESAVRDLADAGFPQTDVERIERNGVPAKSGEITTKLMTAGISNEEARNFTDKISNGTTMVIVNASDLAYPSAVAVLERHGTQHLREKASGSYVPGTETRGAAIRPNAERPKMPGRPDMPAPSPSGRVAAPAGAASAPRDRTTSPRANAGQDEETIPVVEETLTVGKREVESPSIHVFSRVVSEPIEKEISLRQEHINIERRPTNRPATEADFRAFKEGDVEITETREEPVVEKKARVVEDVVISKDVSEEQRTVKDTVRRTEVDVEKGGAGRRFGAAATSTPDIQKADITDKASPMLGRSTEPDIDMAAAQRATAAMGGKPELAPKSSAPRIVKDPSQGPPVPGKPGPSPMPEPVPIEGASRAAAGDMPPEHQHADLYGEKLARDPQYHGKAWETIEPAARHQWTSEHKGTWEEFKERIRNAWERISSH